MENLDISKFTEMAGFDETANAFVLLTNNGTHGRISVDLFLQYISQQAERFAPTIDENGDWNVPASRKSAKVSAAGRTPHLMVTGGQLCVYYDSPSDYQVLTSLDALRPDVSSLTTEQLQTLKLTLADLSDEELAALMKPAAEAATQATTALQTLQQEREQMEQSMEEALENVAKAQEYAQQAGEQARKDAQAARDAVAKTNGVADNAVSAANAAAARAEEAAASAANFQQQLTAAETAAAEAARKAGEATTAADNAKAAAEQAAKDAQTAADQSAKDAQAAAAQSAKESKEASSAAINSMEQIAAKQNITGGTAAPTADGEQTLLTLSKGDGSTVSVTLPGGGGKGGNTVNATDSYPVASGYHTLLSAIKAVPQKKRGKGMCVTYEAEAGRWETRQFLGSTLDSWEQEDAWGDFGGGGTLKGVSVNGRPQTIDGEGNVSITVSETEVDESLDEQSTNPVQNGVVAKKLKEVEEGTVFSMNADLSDDGSTVRLSLNSKTKEIAAVDIPAGSGGGGGGGTSTKIALTASMDKTTLKENDTAVLTWSYDHQTAEGTSTGQKASVTISVRRGSTTTYSETLQDVGRGSYELDLTKYLLLGSCDIYVAAETTDPETGNKQRRQAYVGVKVVNLQLSSSFNPAASLQQGGYGAYDTVSVPFSVSGSGQKTVFLYVDGRQRSAESISRSGTTNSSFSVSMSGLSVGRHTIQLVAEMEAGDDLVLRSESIYIDILKKGASEPFIGLMVTHKDGHIETDNHLSPTMTVGQYEECAFKFVAYDPQQTPASMSIERNGTAVQTVSVARTVQTYQNRFLEKGRQEMVFRVGTASYPFAIDVEESGIDIHEAAYGLTVKLSPSGRSNEEADPAVWESNGVQTSFEGFDWSSNGWTGDSLKLTNGAKAVVGYELFREDAGKDGMTIEMEFKVSQVTDRTAALISCLSGGKGLSVTATEASIKTGTIITYKNEDDKDVSREIRIGTKFAPDEWLKVAFVIGKRSEGRLMELYVNGNRAGADIYDTSYYFRQDEPVGITLASDAADLEVRNIRIYDRALSDDEVLENRMVDAQSTDDMMRLWEENDIMGETGDVDIEKLRAKGKGVLRIVRKEMLTDVYETNNKKTDFSADIYFYSPFGKEYDFVLRDCFIRIQGTSSTKYPSKNIRIYMGKGGQNLSLTVNGEPVADRRYALRPGAVPMDLYCLKSDYSDSSMTLNTGVAKLFNDVMKELGLLTPPQQWQYEHGGNDLGAVTVRQSIDGFPIDVFAAASVDGESEYFGQYNFNNEKSKSGRIFGMEAFDGFEPELPMTLETLNNGEDACLFKSTSDEAFMAKFDKGLETNVPDDVKWAGLSEAQRAALLRLYGWIRSCVPNGATADNIASFKSQKFKDEVGQYFDLKHLLTYYVHTDYFAEVDQRAKNILLRTWDGLRWWLTYYDGDTQAGKRNDCFLAYDYTLDRDTWDAEAGKYAFEGRESWLWNLVLANMEKELKEAAAAYRAKMTLERVLAMLDGEQMGNWSDRAYNKSGWLKYIRPAMQETYGKVWPFIYALQGSNAAHRRYFLQNRFALLDAKYGTNNFTSDNIDLYMARSASDQADTIRMTAGEVYAFGYGTNNSPNISNTGIVEAGTEARLDIRGAYTVNDPLRVYGASRMLRLDMTGAADHLKNGFDLGKCTALRELDMESSRTGSSGWWLSIGSCRQLRRVNLKGQSQAKTGSSTSTELDFKNQTKLEWLDARGTTVQSVTFAKGAPLTTALLPPTISVLRLEYLSKLTDDGLTLEGYGNVKTLIVDGCPGIDWETLLAKCTSADRIRITGIDREDDGSWLRRFLTMGGVDAEGNATDTCSLVGTVRLKKYLAEAEYEQLAAHFPELNIRQPEYTMIEFDDSTSKDRNVSNLDNGTGYKFGTAYKPSGHITAILARRHRVLAKVTRKATQRNVTMAGQSTVVNNPDGEMTYCPLDDSNSYKYADGSDAQLDGSEGDWMMLEPFFWSKGVNDYLNQKHYSCYSSADRHHKPESPAATVLTLDDIKAQSGGVTTGKKIVGKDTLRDSYTSDGSYSVCKVDVDGYKRVRFPTVPGANLVGSVFTDAGGNVLRNVVVPSIGSKFEAGMYLVCDIPDGATALHFTILNTAEFDCVVLSDSDRIEDMEPDWVANDEHLCAVVGSTVNGTKLRAIVSGGSTQASMPWTDFHYYSVQRGMQQIDALMHFRIANLFYAKYGRRDSQDQCGGGSHTNNRTTGGTAKYGMADTIGYTEAVTVNSGISKAVVDNVVYQYAWYRQQDDYGNATVKQISNICCLGYEDIYGHKYDMMDGVDMPNTSGNVGKWRIWMPDGSVRMVKGMTNSDWWITAVAHGKHMDVIPVGTTNGTSSTYYCDKFWLSTAASRVVYRGYSYANANGGVAFAVADSGVSNAFAFVGSRLAFRGKIVKAQSVEAYKAIIEEA